MKAWLLSILGVVFLAVLLDMIYPNGKTNAFCKSIFGVFAVIMLISPIFKIKIDYDNSTNYVDTVLTNNLAKSKNEYLKIRIENALKSKNINDCSVEIKGNYSNNEYEVENIYVDTTDLVLTENITHTNKYEVIIQEILNIIKIDIERIVIYG